MPVCSMEGVFPAKVCPLSGYIEASPPSLHIRKKKKGVPMNPYTESGLCTSGTRGLVSYIMGHLQNL